MIINSFNRDNSNIANIKTQYCQIMATIPNIIFKFKITIKKRILANHVLFTVVTFSRISSFAKINSIMIQNLSDPLIKIKKTNFPQFQKDYHEDNVSLACLQFNKKNCLNIVASNK